VYSCFSEAVLRKFLYLKVESLFETSVSDEECGLSDSRAFAAIDKFTNKAAVTSVSDEECGLSDSRAFEAIDKFTNKAAVKSLMFFISTIYHKAALKSISGVCWLR